MYSPKSLDKVAGDLKSVESQPQTPKDLVAGMIKLVSLPHICIRVNLMVDDPDCSIGDIGEVLSQDASLTAHLLKVANSAFYGYRAKIETVSRAVTIIGTQDLRDLMFAVSAVRTFSNIPIKLANMASFWRHSMFCGIVARILAGRCNVLHTERLFVAGLLHDIGRLIILHRVPDIALSVLQRVEQTHEQSHLVEREYLDFDHSGVGAELMKLWQVPAPLQNAIKYHHDPDSAQDNVLEASIIHIANTIAHVAEMEDSKQVQLQRISPFAWGTTNLTEAIIDDVISDAHPLLFEGLALIMPNA